MKSESNIEEPKLQNQAEQVNLEGGLFHIAFAQRKKINLQKLKQFTIDRAFSYRERTRIFLLLQSLYKEKIEYTKSFIKDFIKYFEETLSLYGYFYKAVSKFELEKQPKEIFIYEAFEKACKQLTELNHGEVQTLKVLTNWIEKILLPALKAVYDMYRDQTKEEKKELDNLFDDVQSLKQKQIKCYEKITENNDLLQNEIGLVDKFDATDEMTIKWGEKLFQAWNNLLKNENQIREQLQKNIIEFHDKFTRVYNQTDASKSLTKFWIELQGAPTWHQTFLSVLNEKDCEHISFGFKTNSLKATLEGYIKLQYEKLRVGDPLKLIEILQNKRFKCKLQKTQREYIDVRIYFTVDNHILVFDEKKRKVAIKLIEQGFQIRRLSENLIELNGVEVGFLIDSKKKENVHFGTMDEAEEFVFFVENLLKDSMN